MSLAGYGVGVMSSYGVPTELLPVVDALHGSVG